ncbi:uncharacterized protein [Musca autumnalis]|uniref:uncharacterized protein n=1 Tax=Musca autumnalis TaxID=221902 RepID=UPI003CEA95C9
METPNTNKEFEVLGVSRSGRIRKKSSKLLDFQSPDESIQRKMYKRSNTSTGPRNPVKHGGRGRPRKQQARAEQEGGGDDMAEDDDEIMDNENELDEKIGAGSAMQSNHTDIDDIDDDDDLDDMVDDDDMADDEDVLGHNTESDDDGFGELVADLVGTEGGSSGLDRNSQKPDSNVRKSLYMSEKRSAKDGRLERKDKGKSRCTAYSLWAREYRKTANFGKEVDFTTAKRELWANVSNKEKNNWRRKAKIQATKAKALERAGGNVNRDKKLELSPSANTTNSTFINRPTTSRTKKLQLQAEEKQKAKESMSHEVKVTTPTSRRTRNNSYTRKSATSGSGKNSNALALYANGGGSTSNYDVMGGGKSSVYNVSTPLPTIEPIDAAAHLKLLGESLTIIGERLKDHEGQIAVSGSLSVLLDSLLCSLGPLLCLTTCLPGLEKKTKLKTNLAVTLDNIAYVLPGL